MWGSLAPFVRGGTGNLPAFQLQPWGGEGEVLSGPEATSQAACPWRIMGKCPPPCLKVAEEQLWGLGGVPLNALKELPEIEPSHTNAGCGEGAGQAA